MTDSGLAYRGRQTRIGYVWRPALAYGCAYAVFVLLAKLSAPFAVAAPFSFACVYAFGAAVPLALAARKGVKRRFRANGPNVEITSVNMISAGATVLIAASTVAAYMFEGVSILLALVLMRLGVLMLAPLIDLVAGRHVRPAAWTALAIALAVSLLGALTQSFRALTPGSAAVLAVYLGAYGVRLSLMTMYAKSEDRAVRGDWFLVEIGASAAISILVAAILAPDFLVRAVHFDAGVIIAGLLAGFAYGHALVHGTLIYLDWRENAFSITVNRAASLLAGLVASLAGGALALLAWPPFQDWLLAAATAMALGVLYADTLATCRRRKRSSHVAEDKSMRSPRANASASQRDAITRQRAES